MQIAQVSISRMVEGNCLCYENDSSLQYISQLNHELPSGVGEGGEWHPGELHELTWLIGSFPLHQFLHCAIGVMLS